MPQYSIKREDEEAIFRKKLKYDGYGTGEERKLIQVIRNITTLCLVDQSSNNDFQKLITSTNQCIAASINNADRQLDISKRCDKTIAILEKTIEEKEAQLREARSSLAKLELELQYVDKLKEISVYPDCQTTEAEIKEVQARRDKLVVTISKYRDHIKILLESCNNLRPILEDDITIEPTTNHK